MTKKFVAAGCSFTRDYVQKTWADFVAHQLDLELINVGARGAGLDFISKRLMIALHDFAPCDTLVGIMLPSMDRFDCYVTADHAARKSLLDISSWQYGRKPEFINLDGTTSDSYGYSLSGGEARGLKKHWYKYYYSSTAAYINYWFNVIHLQNYLELKRFRYFFTSAYDIDSAIEQPTNQDGQEIEYSAMKKLVDFDRFILYHGDRGFLSFVNDHSFAVVRNHPTEEAHKAYVQQVLLPQLDQL